MDEVTLERKVSSHGSWNEQKNSHNLNHIDFLLGKTNNPPVPVL